MVGEAAAAAAAGGKTRQSISKEVHFTVGAAKEFANREFWRSKCGLNAAERFFQPAYCF